MIDYVDREICSEGKEKENEECAMYQLLNHGDERLAIGDRRLDSRCLIKVFIKLFIKVLLMSLLRSY